MSEPTLKRKRLPTFHHLPAGKAKKLKQAWVENKKIKTQWKAQKRREGLTTQPNEEVEKSDEEDVNDSNSGSYVSEGDVSEKEDYPEDPEALSEPEENPAPKKSTLHPSRSHIHPELAPKPKRPKVSKTDPSSPPPSLRELTRQAYSRESLHTFKAGQRTRGSTNGRGRGRGASRGVTGRGQPNMKLRMGAMLEKIKQSVA